MPFQLRVLGPPELRYEDGSPCPLSLGKPLALLVRLAFHPGPHFRDELCSLLWPEAPRSKARHSLRQALWVLKTTLGQEILEGEDPLLIRPGCISTDLDEFRSALAEGRISEAKLLWRGPFLSAFALPGLRAWDNWVEDLRSSLDLRYYQALLGAADEARRDGDLQQALGDLNLAIQIAGGMEAAHLAKIETLIQLRRPHEAREAVVDAHSATDGEFSDLEAFKVLESRIADLARGGPKPAADEEEFSLEFVGRARELSILQDLWKESESGSTQTVTITGHSGIGKTRLAREFLSDVTLMGSRPVSVTGSRAGMKIRWGAAADLVRSLLLLPGSAGISPSSDSILRALIPSLGKTELNPQTLNGISPATLLDAMADLVDSVSYETPLVVLLDDFQWFDRESRTLLTSLMCRSRDLRVLFLVCGRSDLGSRSWQEASEALEKEGEAGRIVLFPLKLEETRELLTLMARFPSQPDAERLVNRFHEVTGGNPLFIQALLRDLADRGILQPLDGGWEFVPSDHPPEIHFPENIKSLLRERVEKLSAPARELLGRLATEGQGRPLLPSELVGPSEAEGLPLAQGTPELLERGVVEWTEDGRLAFAHDLLFEVASDHLLPWTGGPGRTRLVWKRHRVPVGLAAGVLVALPLWLFWGIGSSNRNGDPEPAPYGGGTVTFQPREEGPIQQRVTDLDPASWKPGAPLGQIPAGVRKIFRGPNGDLLFFGAEDHPEGPDLVRIMPDGRRISIAPGPGDQTLFDLSPRGDQILLGSERMDQEGYAMALLLHSLEEGDSRLLLAHTGPLATARWSPDGDLIAVGLRAAQDTLLLLSTQGDRITTRVFDEISNLDWCGPTLVIQESGGDHNSLVRLDPPDFAETELASLSVRSTVTCSPDGSVLIHREVAQGKIVPVLRDLDTGEALQLRSSGQEVSAIDWIPDRLPPVAVRLEVPADTVRIGWGERRSLDPLLVFSDGTTSDEELSWKSRDPSIATVGPDGLITGNSAGATVVTVAWGHSLNETIQVVVEDTGEGGAYLREDFRKLNAEVWLPLGLPPQVADEEGQPVLVMRGDEKYRDGLITRHPIPLDRGVTVEMEFRIALNRNLHQTLILCIQDTDLNSADLETGYLNVIGQEVCFRYPAQELEKMDPSEVSLVVTPQIQNLVNIEGGLPGERWVHVGLQIRADGEVSLILDRERVATSPVRIETHPRHGWHLSLEGTTVGTEAFVRHLTVWSEPRY